MSIRYLHTGSKNRTRCHSIIADPVSAVRELIDNSIDAEAKKITIKVDADTVGCRFILVRDDGKGILPKDRPLAFLYQTSSKIRCMKDFSECETLGFRGEALSLLCKLACQQGSMEVITRCEREPFASRWFVVSTGEIKDGRFIKEIHPQGTTFIVRSLFSGSAGANRQILARSEKKMKELEHLILHYSMIHSNVEFLFELTNMNKNNPKTKKQLRYLDEKCDREAHFAEIISLGNPTGHLKTFQNILVNDSVELFAIFPALPYSNKVKNLRCNLKFPTINGRALSTNRGFGKRINNMIKVLFKKYGHSDPKFWFVELTCDKSLVNFNVRPGKDDVLMKNAKEHLSQLSSVLSSMLKRMHEFNCDTISDNHSIFISEDSVKLKTDFTKAIVSPENLCQDSRMLNSVKTFSEEIDWFNDMDTMIDDVRCQLSTADNIISSLTHNYEQPDMHDNDDLLLSGNLSLSNPFILSKFRGKNQVLTDNSVRDRTVKCIHDSDINYKAEDSIGTSQLVISNNSKIEDFIETTELSDNSITLVEPSFIDVSSGMRSIYSFSEYTHDYVSHRKVMLRDSFEKMSFKTKYKKELVWIFRKGTPSLPLIDGIQRKSEELDSNVDLQLELQTGGWFIVSL